MISNEQNICVYRHVRLDTNQVFYLGIGKGNRPYYKNGRNNYCKKIVNKTDYRVDILFDNLSWAEACEKEIEFIALYGRMNLGTGTLANMTDGGDGMVGFKHSKESIIKMSLAKKGKVKSDETKLNMAKAQKGKVVSEETRKKLSEVQKGKTLSEEHKLKISIAAKGRIFSEETKLNMSEATKLYWINKNKC